MIGIVGTNAYAIVCLIAHRLYWTRKPSITWTATEMAELLGLSLRTLTRAKPASLRYVRRLRRGGQRNLNKETGELWRERSRYAGCKMPRRLADRGLDGCPLDHSGADPMQWQRNLIQW